jgi:hypothetical protein
VGDLEKIAVLDHEIEARLLDEELKAREIPHVLRSYHDQAYDGVFQLQRGWGVIQAPGEFRDEILTILGDLRSGKSTASDPLHEP